MPAHHTIKIFPDPVLRKVSKPAKLDAKTLDFIEDLIKTMTSQPGGIGIAAPQVGVLKQIAIVDVSTKVRGTKRLVLINPELLDGQDEIVFREGCMSLPHHTANTRRWNRVKIRFMGLDGRRIEHEASGLEAICIQHEIDHLNGLLFLERVGCLNTDVFRRKKYL